MTMTKTEAWRLTRINKSYGWFRDSLTAPAGYRFCPQCRVKIHAEVSVFDGPVERTVNKAVDALMIDHLLTECEN